MMVPACAGSCLRRNDGEGRRNDGEGCGSDGWVVVVRKIGARDGGSVVRGVGDRGVKRPVVVVCGVPPPHLTSPLKGGRDELGKGEVGAGVGWFLPAQE